MIDLQHVSVAYEDTYALRDVSLSIEKGEFVFLVGASGAGKSTLIRLLYHGQLPTSGKVIVAGQRVNELRSHDVPYFRRKMGIVFQDFGLLPDKTVFENVAFALRVIGASRRDIRRQAPLILEMVGLDGRCDALPAQLSGGEQQRVAIARALVNNPPLLLADELTGNLDPETSKGIIDLLHHINLRGTTVLVATHDQIVVDCFRRRVIELDKGHLVRDEEGGAYFNAVIQSSVPV